MIFRFTLSSEVRSSRFYRGAALACTLFMAVSGCAKQEEIEQRDVPRLETKPKDEEPKPPPRERIIGLIAPHGSAPGWWFFKLRGPAERVEAERAVFMKWLETIQLPSEQRGKPRWVTPESWVAGKGDGIRDVIFQIGKDNEGLDCAVSYASGSMLDNINRWREQVGLPLMDASGLEKSFSTKMINGRLTFFVEVAGPGGKKKMPPFAHPPK